MKATELIAKLQEMVEEHGDCETCYIETREAPYQTIKYPRFMKDISYQEGRFDIE